MSVRTVAVAVATLVFGCGNVSDNKSDIDAPGAATCSDGAKNGAETDVDCGGATCGACGDTRGCTSASDCTSKVCTNQVCQAASCTDGITNADELDVDCAGQCGAASCDPGQMCTANAQCASNMCAGVCIAPKRAFLTNAIYSGGQIGGLAGADTKCQGAALAGGLTGTYKAWLSDATGSPATRFTQSTAPYVRVDGIVIANNWADLTDGTHNAPLNKTETGALGASEAVCDSVTNWVFTNTTTDGNQADGGSSCSDWTSDLGGSIWGRFTTADSQWTSSCSGGSPVNFCGKRTPLYCFEQ